MHYYSFSVYFSLYLIYFCIFFMMSFHYIFIFFFFKQQTAYEVRISDWSSDVCSSDLYAANFGKRLKGYLELRQFSAESFFNGPHLIEQLERIPAAFEVWPAHSHPFEQAFRRKFLLLSRWLVRIRGKLEWDLTHGLVAATGRVHFAGEPLGHLMAHGRSEEHTSA